MLSCKLSDFNQGEDNESNRGKYTGEIKKKGYSFCPAPRKAGSKSFIETDILDVKETSQFFSFTGELIVCCKQG